MSKSNTENVDENNEEKLENLKPTLRNTLFAEYRDNELLFPNEKLVILKKKLEFVRSRVDKKFKKNLSPIRRPMEDDSPLHEVYKNVINRDSFTILANENTVFSKKSTENQKIKSTANNIKSICNDNTNIQKFNKPLNIEKDDQINSPEINENAKSLDVAQDNTKKIKITSTKYTRSLKKKVKQHNKIVSTNKTK